MTVHQCPNCGCNLTRFAPFTYGNVGLDERGEITFEGRPIALCKTQREIVEALVRARGRGLTRSALANMLGGDVNDSSISKYIERARAAFRRIDPCFEQIEVLRGFGAYRWAHRPAAAPGRPPRPARARDPRWLSYGRSAAA